MPTNGLTDILEELSQVTENGKLKWDVDPTGGYLVYLGNYIINIYEGLDQDAYVVRMLDSTSNVVDIVTSDVLDSNYSLLKRLFEASRRSALNIDEAISNVLQTIRGL